MYPQMKLQIIKKPASLFIICFLVISFTRIYAQNSLYPPKNAWDDLSVSNWIGQITNKNTLLIMIPGTTIYKVPDGPKGWFMRGLMREYDGVIDARQWYGIRFNVKLDNDAPFKVNLAIYIPRQTDRHNLPDSATASASIQGKGWHTVTIPFSSFNYNRGQIHFLKFIKQITLSGKYETAQTKGQMELSEMKLVMGNPLFLESEIRSKPGDADSTVIYLVTIGNSSNETQLVNLSIRRSGWEEMKIQVNPSTVTLKPGEKKPVKVLVTVPSMASQGAQEKQILVASTFNGISSEMEFTTVCRLKSPYLLLTEDGWKDVLIKTSKYDWAKKQLDEYVRRADEFQVPETPEGNLKNGEVSTAVFKSYLEQRFWPVAIAYKLTGKIEYADKLALLLRRLSAPGAYPTTLHANSQGIPQEGGFWEAIARSYDLIRNSGVLSVNDKELIDQSLRLYIYTIEDAMGDGGISNWSVFNLCPAAQCALAIQDMYHFNYLMDGPCGIKDHMRYGTMDDGWWYEVSLSYNVGCVENMTSLGLAAKPFGIDFLNERIPAPLTKNVGLRPFEFENFQGMAFGKVGPVKRNFITVKDMWDAITIYPDYRGIMFGMGDGHEQKVGSGPFEQAYFAFKDINYAAVLKQADKRDIIYGVPELPAMTPKLYSLSGRSDNAGVAVLRSQTEGREQRGQIQAALKYGTHGSYHGHFDKISLLSLMRYGRSFWNPETSWFGYGSYMYKWWVQPSMAHNMVVVDGKMQEPKETTPLLFHSGKMMQVMAVETDARWSNPPYMGGYDQIEKVKAGSGSFVEIPDNHPAVADVTDYTEPVLQRRLMIVTDDYVVLADYLKAGKEHIFDNLLHLRGAKAGEDLKFIGHDAQFDFSPLSSGQFITSVDKYKTNKGAKITSRMITSAENGWDTGGFNGFQEPGLLNIDVYQLWPEQAEVRIGNYAESKRVSKKMVYEVVADGKLLATESMGTWILGNKAVKADLTGSKKLQLRVKTDRGGGVQNTLFWANAKIVNSKGKEIPLSQIKSDITNVIPVKEQGKDYNGGPIKIAGSEYSDVLATEPQNTSEYAVISFDLTGLDAKSFKANIGGDYPVGDEDQVRKTISYRTTGSEARYLTVLEPFEDKNMVKKITALSAGELDVELADGRSQRIIIENLDNRNGIIKVRITEVKNGKMIRSEQNEYNK